MILNTSESTQHYSKLAFPPLLEIREMQITLLTGRILPDKKPFISKQPSSIYFPLLQHLISATSEQLFDVTGGLGRFGDVTVVLPSSWASTECADGLETTVSAKKHVKRQENSNFL